jgi:hypothetical protein
MLRKSRSTLVLRLLSVTLLVTATGCSKCSSGSAPTDAASATQASPKAQYITKLDALCTTSDDNSAKEMEKLPKPTTPEEALKFSTSIFNISLDTQESLVKEIQKIAPPTEDSALLGQIIQDDAKRMEAARSFGKAMMGEISKDELKAQQDQLKAMAKNVNDLARKYGFKVCFTIDEK